MKTPWRSRFWLVIAAGVLSYAFSSLEQDIEDGRLTEPALAGPLVTPPPGVYASPFSLTLQPRVPEGEVWYALGSQPLRRYAAPIRIESDTVVRVREIRPSGEVRERIAYYQIGAATELALPGVTLWYNQPSAVRYRGRHDRSYFVWLAGTAVTIRYFDHGVQQYSAPVIIGHVPRVNDHAAPAIHVVAQGKNAGRILVFYGMPNERLFLKRSSLPEDIATWGPAQTAVAGRVFYPNPVGLRSGRVLLFFSSNPDPLGRMPLTHRVLNMITSENGGDTWSQARTLVDFGNGYWIYAAPVSAFEGRITLAWTRYSYRRNNFRGIFLAESRDEGNTWTRPGGQPFPLPIDQRTALDTLHGQASSLNTRVWDVQGTPQGAALTFVTYTARGATNHFGELPEGSRRLRYSRIGPTTSGYYPGGAVMLPGPSLRVLVAVLREGRGEIEAWCSRDRGASWSSFFRLTQHSLHDQVRPQLVAGGGNDLRVTWLDAPRYDSYFNFAASLRTNTVPDTGNECGGL